MLNLDRNEFAQVLRELLPHLKDFSILETHPLAELGTISYVSQGSRGQNLQQLIIHTIEKLQPKDIKPSSSSVEWRPYLILYKRYVEGLNLQELSTNLSLSERQIRRDHNRAVLALAGRLWDQYFSPIATNMERSGVTTGEVKGTPQEANYEILPEVLDLNELLNGVRHIMQRRLEEEEVGLELDLPQQPLQAISDRIILRQVLFSLFKYALHLLDGKTLRISLDKSGEICYQFHVDSGWRYWRQEEHEDLLTSVRYWVQRIKADFKESYPSPGREGEAELRLALLLPSRTPILVVDDQQPALRMFQRYLSASGYEVIGVTDPAQVLPLARQLNPALITLDVMMPRLDGWEILQALQLEEKTRRIPVIICSAWEEPELARSLGASAFLKKPIVRSDLLEALNKLGLQ
jgi:CheY-like chemotaxis protein